MNILVIDDKRTFNFPATYARTFEEAENILFYSLENFDEVWLDHDLGEKKTGYDLALEIENRAFTLGEPTLKDTILVIHSSNPVGRERMRQALEKWYSVKMVRAEDFI